MRPKPARRKRGAGLPGHGTRRGCALATKTKGPRSRPGQGPLGTGWGAPWARSPDPDPGPAGETRAQPAPRAAGSPGHRAHSRPTVSCRRRLQTPRKTHVLRQTPGTSRERGKLRDEAADSPGSRPPLGNQPGPHTAARPASPPTKLFPGAVPARAAGPSLP